MEKNYKLEDQNLSTFDTKLIPAFQEFKNIIDEYRIRVIEDPQDTYLDVGRSIVNDENLTTINIDEGSNCNLVRFNTIPLSVDHFINQFDSNSKIRFHISKPDNFIDCSKELKKIGQIIMSI